jgi:aminoglycoside phosphotransferase family enzyme/predicted kinase
VETHSAVVVMLGDRAYKVKKPVALGFLDFSTREAREAVVHREVELNRRLAPDVYLGVADVLAPDGTPCDHLVVMRRMPDDRRLATLVRDGAATEDDMRDLARAIACFHAGAARSEEIAAAGAPDVVSGKVRRDLDELAKFASAPLPDATLSEVATLVRRYLGGRRPLLEARVGSGCICDGHGDLLADDVFCLPDGPRILDCIEFDDGLRHGDVLADVCFLAMDLEHLGSPELAARLLDWYVEFSDEHHPQSLVDYYIAFRALIRTKVACIRAEQGDADARARACELLELAAAHLRQARVRLVLVGGAPGTGKTTVAGGLADSLGWVLLRSDVVRKELAGLPAEADATAALGAGLYSEESSAATYAELLRRARRSLEHGEPVVLDASWARQRHRGLAREVADATVSDLVELCCEAPISVAAVRIGERRRRSLDASDATVDVARAVRAAFDPWPSAVVIDTTRPEAAALELALGAAAPERVMGPTALADDRVRKDGMSRNRKSP